MRLGILLLSSATLALAAGCLKVDSGTTLKKDGSGTYVQTSTLEMKKAAEYQKMLLAKARSLGIPDDEGAENPYATLDAKDAARWDQGAKKWTTLDSKDKTSLPSALRIARKQEAPSLIRLPVNGAEDVK